MKPSGHRIVLVSLGTSLKATRSVLTGILRYLLLAWRKGDVGRPERVLLSDRILWLIIGGYAVSAVVAVAVSR